MTSSDHFRHASSGHAAGMTSESRAERSAYDSDSDSSSDGGHAVYDRTTKVNESHDFVPGVDSRTGVERRKNEVVTTTRQDEVNYF